MAADKKLNVRRSIERLLLPALVARGFRQSDADARNIHNPYGRFRRHAAHGIEIVEVQFNKNNLARFRLNLAVATAACASLQGAPIAPEDQWVGMVLPRYHMTRCGTPFRIWFGVRKPARKGITEAEFDAAVELVIRRIPQIERLFATGKRSWRMEENPVRASVFVLQMILGILAIGIPIGALLWLAGYLVRHL